MRPFRSLTISVAVAVPLSLALVLLIQGAPATAQSDRQSVREDQLAEFDLSNHAFELENLLGPFVPVDGIPPLTMPKRAPALTAKFPSMADRVIVVEINGEAAAYPLLILNHHEIANDVVGGEPISVTYCPLCDSAAVVRRRVEIDGETKTIELGVSGFLLNSNVVMYDRETKGLWSQAKMRCLSGPLVGRSLEHLPVRVMSFQEFIARHATGSVMTSETGHARDYRRNPYQQYLDDPDYLPERFKFEHDDRLPPKTLGLGVFVNGESTFVPADELRGAARIVKTPSGGVVATATDAGVEVLDAPDGAHTMQVFYHSWSAFHPGTRIARDLSEAPDAGE